MRYLIQDQTTARWAGVALLVTGAYLLYQAYEGRGRRRPFALRFLPGGSI